MNALIAIFWIGMIGTGLYYWFTQGRKEDYLTGRIKTALAACFWYVYLIVLLVNREKTAARQVETDEAKKRILG